MHACMYICDQGCENMVLPTMNYVAIAIIKLASFIVLCLVSLVSICLLIDLSYVFSKL